MSWQHNATLLHNKTVSLQYTAVSQQYDQLYHAPKLDEVCPHHHHPVTHVAILIVELLAGDHLGMLQNRLIQEGNPEYIGQGSRV